MPRAVGTPAAAKDDGERLGTDLPSLAVLGLGALPCAPRVCLCAFGVLRHAVVAALEGTENAEERREGCRI